MGSFGGADVKVIRSEGSLPTTKDCDADADSYSESPIPLAPIVHVPAAMK